MVMIKKIFFILLIIFCFSSCQKKNNESQEIYNRLMMKAIDGSDVVWKGLYFEEGQRYDYILAYGGENNNIKLTIITFSDNDKPKQKYVKDLQVVDAGKNWTTLAPIGVENVEDYKTKDGLRFIVNYSDEGYYGKLQSLDGRFVLVMRKVG